MQNTNVFYYVRHYITVSGYVLVLVTHFPTQTYNRPTFGLFDGGHSTHNLPVLVTSAFCLSLHRSCSLPLLFFPIAPLVILPLCAQTLSAEKREQAAKCIMFYHCPQVEMNS